MAIPITLPDLGAADETIHVSAWLVRSGEEVIAGDRVVEVFIRGVTFDVAAPVSGLMGKIEKSRDTPIVPGDILGWIDTIDDKSTE